MDLLSEFESRLKNYRQAFFYFIDHGFEVEGENYLVFTECHLDHANNYHCKQTCIQLTNL